MSAKIYTTQYASGREEQVLLKTREEQERHERGLRKLRANGTIVGWKKRVVGA